MKKIFFTHSYFLRFDPKQWATGQPYAPLGTLYAAAFMRQQGNAVSFFDAMFATGPSEIIPFIEKEQPDIFVIYDDGFNYLTKMCLENMRDAAFEMIRFAKDKGCTVVVSSSDSTDRYEMYLNKGADFILLGEAELSLLELTNSLTKKETDFFSIEGLAFKHNDAVVKTKRRNVLKDLDSLPYPAWDIIDIEPYRKMWLKHTGYFSVNMGTTRGCPFKCNWCAKPIYGNRYNSRSPKNVVNELKMLKERFGFDHVWFCDDIFGLKPGWVKEFADLIENENLVFRFKIQGRVDLLLQENNIRDLARAGCANIWMGAESGSQKILDAMDKGTTVEQIYEATRLLKKCGIKPSFFIQFGYLTETKEDIDKTIAMINELLPYEIGISVSYPLPGTVFFEKVKSQLVEKTNWKDSDELALMFSNTYQPAFYRQLHRYVHKTYRMHIAFENIKQLLAHPFKMSAVKIKKATSALYYLPASYIDKIKLQRLKSRHMDIQIDHKNEQQAAFAFSQQSAIFDKLYASNSIVQYKRKRVRDHLLQYLKPASTILELNAGTGEDAIFLAEQGHYVHATDIASGMQEKLKEKVASHDLSEFVSNELCSYTALNRLKSKGPYDCIFSNFAGLNCTGELEIVLSSFSNLLKPGGIIVLVILPKFCLWETALVLKGKFKTAARRFFSAKGRKAKIDGNVFTCWYYSPGFIAGQLENDFTLMKIEGLCTIVPPSYVENFAQKYPKTFSWLCKMENKFKGRWPWKFIGDYYIISMKKK